jgi:hypothetical protein
VGTSGAVRASGSSPGGLPGGRHQPPAAVRATDVRRLGKSSAYRLGQLRQKGVRIEGPPTPFRPQFGRNYRRGPVTYWVLGLLAGVVVIGAGTRASLWFLPFVAGVAAGLANQIGGWRLRVALPAVALMALAGWGLPLAWHVLHTTPHASVARTVADLGGPPGSASAGYAVLLLAAVAEALAGYWLGRALIRRLTWLGPLAGPLSQNRTFPTN